jgi:hypothetical protein
MFASDKMFTRSAAPALALAALLSAPVSAPAQSAGPFSPFAGSFHGGGAVIGSDGHKERLTCRVNGTVGDGGESLSQTIVCASDSYRLDIHGHAVAQGSGVSGDWRESTRGVSGALSGRVSDGHFSGSVSGGSLNAGFSLRVSGRRLSFDLRPQGGDVARVDVSLSR